MRFRLIVGTVCLAVAIGTAQELKPPAGTGVVSGRVIDAKTGAPIAAARVHLLRTRPFNGFYSDVTSERDGTFVFGGVPYGEVDLSAYRDGYVQSKFGRRRPEGNEQWIPLAEGEQVRDVEILMWPGASVSGRVTDASGKPHSGVFVQAWRLGAPAWEHGRVSAAGSAKSNDTGDYTITPLMPGRYVMAVHATKTTIRQQASVASCGVVPAPPRPGSLVPHIGMAPFGLPSRPPGRLYVDLPRGFPTPPAVEGQPARTYASEFYPGGIAPDFENALKLESGEVRSGVDLSLRLVEAVRVSGRLEAPLRAKHADVILRHPGFTDDHGIEARTWMEPDGTFTLLDVPPGRYTLYEKRFDLPSCDVKSSVQGEWSDREIEISELGVRDLVVERPVVTTLRGRVILHGKPADDFQTEDQVDISVAPVDHAESDRHRGGSESNGAFEVPEVVPGRYLLAVEDALGRDRWWPESITLDGRDVTGQIINVGSVEMTRFVVTVTATPLPLEGAVYGSNARVAATAAVVAFPVDRARWSTLRSPTMGSTRAWKGRFKFDHLPAGEYYVTAMDDARMEDWPSASFLDLIRGGATRITIKAGQKQVVSLPLR